MSILSLSPLDGRYATKVARLAPLLSEFGLMHRRVQVEVAWFVGLSRLGLTEFPALSQESISYLMQVVANFSESDAAAIKAIERITNHDVKAVEYWLTGFKNPSGDWVAGVFEKNPSLAKELQLRANFVHFACTSEDINNSAHALMLQAARLDVMGPRLAAVLQALQDQALQHADLPMLSRTHGQTATPTTVGKEFANFYVRVKRGQEAINAVPLRAKLNGAVGNYNAHLSAYPNIDWEGFARQVVEQDLGLPFQDYSTQIEPHDDMAQLFHAFVRVNTVLLDVSRDVWGYISVGYFKQKLKAGEIGSSTMPHKVNPIDFENAEGNLGLANALLEHMAAKLPVSRWQRDLSDSTVLRNMGVALGYSLLAYESLLVGLGKLEVNPEALARDLDNAWEVLAEPIQTVMRRYGLFGAYEHLKDATRGKTVTAADMHGVIDKLDIPAAHKAELLALTPQSYSGKAAELARRLGS